MNGANHNIEWNDIGTNVERLFFCKSHESTLMFHLRCWAYGNCTLFIRQLVHGIRLSIFFGTSWVIICSNSRSPVVSAFSTFLSIFKIFSVIYINFQEHPPGHFRWVRFTHLQSFIVVVQSFFRFTYICFFHLCLYVNLWSIVALYVENTRWTLFTTYTVIPRWPHWRHFQFRHSSGSLFCHSLQNYELIPF